MFEYEKEKQLAGYKLIAGMDEAGRGPLAGAVYTAMVIMPLDGKSVIEGVNDSKRLTAKARERLYDQIINRAVAYAICPIDEKTIDKINILEATKLGMQNCLKEISTKPDYCLVDFVANLQLDCPFKTIVKGDALSYNIACASILAKVSRDRYMLEVAKQYPQYGFEQHKGYGTALHYSKLNEFGVSPIHRISFLKNLKEHNEGNKKYKAS